MRGGLKVHSHVTQQPEACSLYIYAPTSTPPVLQLHLLPTGHLVVQQQCEACHGSLRTHSQLLNPTDPWDFLHLSGLSITSSMLQPSLHLGFNFIYCPRVTGSGNSASHARRALDPSRAWDGHVTQQPEACSSARERGSSPSAMGVSPVAT